MKKFVILIAVVLIFAGVWYLTSRGIIKIGGKEGKVEEVIPPTPEIYESAAYSFTFDLEESLKVTEESSSRVAVYRSGVPDSKPAAYVEVITEKGDVEVPYEQFVLDETRLLCEKIDTDSSCPQVKSLVAYTNKNALEAQKFMLIFKDVSGERDKGPFFAFNFSINTPGKMSFILVRPPLTHFGSVPVIEKVAETLDF